MDPLHIDYRTPDQLKPNPRNARTHSKKQIRQIAESIRLFGFTNPVLVDSEGMILAGHGRAEACVYRKPHPHLIGSRNHLTSEQNVSAALLRPGRLGLAIQVEEPT